MCPRENVDVFKVPVAGAGSPSVRAGGPPIRHRSRAARAIVGLAILTIASALAGCKGPTSTAPPSPTAATAPSDGASPFGSAASKASATSSPASSPAGGAGPGAVTPAAEALADKPARTLPELWAKRLATAYVALVASGFVPPATDELSPPNPNRDVVTAASTKLSTAMQLTTIDEELAILASLEAIAPVFEVGGWTYDALGAKSAVPEGSSAAKVHAAEEARRRPLYLAIYRKLGPMGRQQLAVYRHDPDTLRAMLGISKADAICPKPLHAGYRGFERFDQALAEAGCPTAVRPMPVWPKDPLLVDATTHKELAPAEALPRCVAAAREAAKPPARAREAWFAEIRGRNVRDVCATIAGDLVEKEPKKHAAELTAAFAAADVETRAVLLQALLATGARVSPEDLLALAADKTTREAARRALTDAHRMRDFPKTHAGKRALDEGLVVARVRAFFGGPPDEVTFVGETKRAADGKPARGDYYRFRAAGEKDNAGVGSFEYVVGEESGTRWDPRPGALREFFEKSIHEPRSVSIFESQPE